MKFNWEFFRSYMTGRMVEKTSSTINPILEVNYINGKYHLDAENVNYSNGSLYRVFDKIFHKIHYETHHPKDVLLLGFGAGSVASLIQDKYHNDCNFVSVEKDQEVIRLGSKYFDTARFLHNNIICADANDFINENHQHFDLIVFDCYIDSEVPDQLEKNKFLEGLHRALKKGGMLLFNKFVFDKKSKTSAGELKIKFDRLPDVTELFHIHENMFSFSEKNVNWMFVHYRQN